MMLKDATGKSKEGSLTACSYFCLERRGTRGREGEWKEKSDKQSCPLGLADITDLKVRFVFRLGSAKIYKLTG